MHNDSLEIRCIDQHIKFEIEKHQLRVSNWQTNVVDLVLPYEKWNIEGGIFVFDWFPIFGVYTYKWSFEKYAMLSRLK